MSTPIRTLSASLTVLALALFLLVPKSSAQEDPDLAYVGFQGGLNQSTFTGDGTDANSLQGFNGGLQFILNLNEALSIELDALYSRKGADDVTATGGPNVSDAYDYDGDELEYTYLEFPALVRLTAPIEVVKVRALAGPSFSVLRTAKQNGNESQVALQSEADVTDRLLKYDLGAVLGGEIAVPLYAGTEVALTGRYHLGLKDIQQIQGFDSKNRSLTGSIAFRIPLRVE